MGMQEKKEKNIHKYITSSSSPSNLLPLLVKILVPTHCETEEARLFGKKMRDVNVHHKICLEDLGKLVVYLPRRHSELRSFHNANIQEILQGTRSLRWLRHTWSH